MVILGWSALSLVLPALAVTVRLHLRRCKRATPAWPPGQANTGGISTFAALSVNSAILWTPAVSPRRAGFLSPNGVRDGRPGSEAKE